MLETNHTNHREGDDIVIIGAGLSGLSLAAKLVRASAEDRFHPGRILIVDPRERFDADRTWCFFDSYEHGFENLVSKSWRNWRVANHKHDTTSSSEYYTYDHISAADFYEATVNELFDSGLVQFELGTEVLSVGPDRGRVGILTTRGRLKSDLVFDSRPKRVASGAGLYQHFYGCRIKTSSGVFDSKTATLMDFWFPEVKDTAVFAYVLPFSSDDALVEITCIGPGATLYPLNFYKERLRSYLSERLAVNKFEIGYEETGVIPMMRGSHESGRTGGCDSIIPIGMAAGMARPSSGYAFLNIQKHSSFLIDRLATGKSLRGFCPYAQHEQVMDDIFLKIVEEKPRRFEEMMLSLFRNCPSDSVVRFMTSEGTVSDALKIAGSMSNKTDFIRIAATTGGARALGFAG